MPKPVKVGEGLAIMEGSGARPGCASQISVMFIRPAGKNAIPVSLNRKMMATLADYLLMHIAEIDEEGT